MAIHICYQCGYNIEVEGTEGVDYAIENHYHDIKAKDVKVIFVKPSTRFRMSHHSLNRFGGSIKDENIPPADKPGVIRYKVDRDCQNMGYRSWTNGVIPSQAIDQWLKFEDFTFESGVPVVGTLGPKPGVVQSYSNKANFYWRGLFGPFGQEWHTIAFADDDSAIVNFDGTRAGDGKVILFVVAPTIPCLTITSTGNAQWVTKVPKAYHQPKIVQQSSYFSAYSGTVSVRLADIYGRNIRYRIVTDLEAGGAYTAVGASSVSIPHTAFGIGVSYLQYYSEGYEGTVAYRRIERNPAYPSDGEAHGYLLLSSGTTLQDVSDRKTLTGYSVLWNNFRTNDNFARISAVRADYGWDVFGNLGMRFGSPEVLSNAFVAAVSTPKWTVTKSGKPKSWARYAKEKMIQMITNVDHVGFELSMSGGEIPSRNELNDRGYRDLYGYLFPAITYDLMKGEYRSEGSGTTYADGITPIEDIHIREQLALAAHNCMMWMGGYTELEPGMWGYSRNVGGLAVALAMPSYDSDLYGTSGVDGKTARVNCPYPDQAVTWIKMFAQSLTVPVMGHPNVQFNDSVRALCVGSHPVHGDYHWRDKLDYFTWGTAQGPLQIFMNLMLNNFGVRYPEMEACMLRYVNGTLRGAKDGNSGPAWTATARGIPICLHNNNYPQIVAAIQAYQSLGTAPKVADLMNDARVFGMFGYDLNASGTIVESGPVFTTHPHSQTVAAGGSVTFTVAVSGTPTPNLVWLKDGVVIPNDGLTLTIPSTTLLDAGTYRVQATNVVSGVTQTVLSSIAVLEVTSITQPNPHTPIPSALAPLFAFTT